MPDNWNLVIYATPNPRGSVVTVLKAVDECCTIPDSERENEFGKWLAVRTNDDRMGWRLFAKQHSLWEGSAKAHIDSNLDWEGEL